MKISEGELTSYELMKMQFLLNYDCEKLLTEIK